MKDARAKKRSARLGRAGSGPSSRSSLRRYTRSPSPTGDPAACDELRDVGAEEAEIDHAERAGEEGREDEGAAERPAENDEVRHRRDRHRARHGEAVRGGEAPEAPNPITSAMQATMARKPLMMGTDRPICSAEV